MKRWNAGLLIVVAVVATTGCASKKKQESVASPSSQYPAMNQASLDVPTTPPTAPPASYTPPPQPVVYDAPAAEQPVIDDTLVDASGGYAAPSAPARRTSSGTRYKVKKGESLWSIAQARYGNGNKWKTIAAANPSIDPNRIQAGQTIVLP